MDQRFKKGDHVRAKPGHERISIMHDLEAGRVYIVDYQVRIWVYLHGVQNKSFQSDRLELVTETKEKSMAKFKVGDKARCIKCPAGYSRISVGETYKITGFGKALKDHVSINDDNGLYPDTLFELVEASRTESELERLVRVANEGWEAMHQLYRNYKDQTEAYYHTSDKVAAHQWQMTNGQGNNSVRFRVKKKPSFEPFTVGNGWQVKLEGETLHVGCQQFKAATLKRLLKDLCAGDNGTHTVPGTELRGNRKNLWTNHGSITWEDADRILAALEKAGIK